MNVMERLAKGIGVAVLVWCVGAVAEDWPTFRHDNARSAITAEALAPPLVQEWVFVPLHGPEPAWPVPGMEKARVRFDEVFHVAAVGDAVYFGSSADNKVYCLDAATGQVRWTAFTGGPIRVAPAVIDGDKGLQPLVYVGSDDGYAYCLRATDGAVVWKVRAAYGDDKVLGNGKMISLWPIRTGVLVDKGVAYFAAGVFPNESTFLCAVNAKDGSRIWCNDNFGEEGYKLEFGGISPQGPLLASEQSIFVPSGRAMPAAFERDTGEFHYFAAPGGKVGGTWALLTEDRVVAGAESKRAYKQVTGARAYDAAYAWFPGTHLVVAEKDAFLLTFEELVALDRATFEEASKVRSGIERSQKDLGNKLKIAKAIRGKVSGDKIPEADAKLASLKKQLQDLAAEKKRVEDSVHRWRRPCEQQDALMLAGNVLFAGGAGKVIAVDPHTGQDMWSASVEGKACGLAVANGRLLVSTDTGRIYSFAKTGGGGEIKPAIDSSAFPADDLGALCAAASDAIVATTGVTKGFCLVYGCGTGALAAELAKRTELNIIGVDPDPANVATARQRLDAAGLYGTRVIVDEVDVVDLPYSDYFANLIVSETMLSTGQAPGSPKEILRLTKPCGGVVCLGQPAEEAEGLDLAALRDGLEHPDFTVAVKEDKGRWLVAKRGALPGAGKWTHEYADPANTACSDDLRVKGSLGVLWFGRPGPELMVERHARAAAPVAMDGRMFVQGQNVVMAYDSYNGVLLWQREIPGAVRVRVDSDMSNLVLGEKGLYVAANDVCLRLDPATGETMRTYKIPGSSDKPCRWGYLACVGDTVYGSVAPQLQEPYGNFWNEIVDDDGNWRDFDEAVEKRALFKGYEDAAARYKSEFSKPNERAFWRARQDGVLWRVMSPWPSWGSVATPVGSVTDRVMASDTVFALDTETGKLRWKYEGRAIAHPAIVMGDGLMFVADCNVTEEQKASAMAEREALIAQGVWEKESISYRPQDADIRKVIALDCLTGEKKWDRVIDLTGCGGDRMGLAYADGVLCFFGCFSNHDRDLFKKGQLAWRRITALSGNDGEDMWSRPLNYLRRPVIIGDTILIEPRACDLHTGAIKTRIHPLTGAESTWEFARLGHCCSITSACPSMFFLRGYFLWYYDMEKDQGMLPFGGIRPGCWINTVPANGLVLFPEASSGCTCSYPVRSTVVMQPKSEEKVWATCIQNGPMTPVRHLAVNFGAPGDRRDEDGVMWFSYPHPPSTSWNDYGVNFRLKEKFVDKKAYFSRNALGIRIKGTDKPWVFTSGCEGLTRCAVPLLAEGQGPGIYTVRLYFAESADVAPGQRVFSVKLQGDTVLKGYDIAAETGGKDIGVVKEFTGIKVADQLQVELVPRNDKPDTNEMPVINGIEVIREDITVAQADLGSRKAL